MLSPNTLLHTIDTFKMIRAQHLQFQQETVSFFAMNLQCLHTNVLSFFFYFLPPSVFVWENIKTLKKFTMDLT